MKNWLCLKIRNRTKIPALTILLNIELEVLDNAIRQEKEIKDMQIRKEKYNGPWLPTT